VPGAGTLQSTTLRARPPPPLAPLGLRGADGDGVLGAGREGARYAGADRSVGAGARGACVAGGDGVGLRGALGTETGALPGP